MGRVRKVLVDEILLLTAPSFKHAEQEFKNKKEAGSLTLADEIDFERLKKEEMMRMKKRKEDRRYEKEQTSM